MFSFPPQVFDKNDGSKHLNSRENNIERVLFFYQCPKCSKRRAVWEDGIEFKAQESYCEKCGGVRDIDFKKDREYKTKSVTTWVCSKCGHEEKTFYKKIKQIDRNDFSYIKDRERFCLSDKEGQKYIEYKQNIAMLKEEVKEIEEKEKNKDIYDKVAKIKKLKVPELKKLLNKKLEKEKYIDLNFTKIDTQMDVIVSFTVQDDKGGREDYDSRTELRRLINKTLENTNWRLMSEGVSYKLGVLEGRLRGYNKEEDLVKLVMKNVNKKM